MNRAEDLVGTRWRSNFSGMEFMVVEGSCQYVTVENVRGAKRRRRVLAVALKHRPNSKHGYSAVTR